VARHQSSYLAPSTISGDVIVDEVSLNQKGGSLTATLKKPIRAGLDIAAGHLSGALLKFAGGVTCVLMAPAEKSPKEDETPRFRVTRVSPHRFVVDLVEEQTAGVDRMTQAVLTTIQAQIEAGTRVLVTTEESTKVLKRLRTKSAEQKKRLASLDQSKEASNT
jgi:hypothetical protein